jgi:hypothetical protein
MSAVLSDTLERAGLVVEPDGRGDVYLDIELLFREQDARFHDLAWRLDNLYWIVDKHGKAVKFSMNRQQRRFVERIWNRNLILKARQLGFSTLMQILQLDQALFTENFTGVVIADTLPNAKKLFSKLEFAYDHLPDVIKEALPIDAKTRGEGIEFAHLDGQDQRNPSKVTIGVSARGGTVNLLHVSELGKIALKFPQRAEEIKTGAIPAVPLDGIAVIESTAEGAFGLFYELCEPAMKRLEAGTPETALDWRLHFFPWYESEDYRLSDADVELVEIPDRLRKYFAKLEAELKIKLDRNQRAWYAKTAETLGKKMKQEYPSTPKEAFEQAIEGAVYGDQMTKLREQGRLTVVPLDPNYPVNTFWDFGTNDANVIWFHQQIGIQHRWFYYVEGTGKGLRHWWVDVCQKHRERHGYQWGRHYLPHDADAEILGEVVTTKHKILDELGMQNIVVVPRIATIGQGIEITRKALAGNHWFYDHMPNEDEGDDMGVGQGIKCLDGYQYEWDDKHGIWSNQPLHNWASHGADGWRQHAQGYQDDGGGPIDTGDHYDPYERREGRRTRSWKTS